MHRRMKNNFKINKIYVYFKIFLITLLFKLYSTNFYKNFRKNINIINKFFSYLLTTEKLLFK